MIWKVLDYWFLTDRKPWELLVTVLVAYIAGVMAAKHGLIACAAMLLCGTYLPSAFARKERHRL